MSKVSYDFSGERFVVTGASSGMGRQIAVELAEAGAKVLAIARRTERLEELGKQYSGQIIPGVLDVRDSEKMSEAVVSFVAEHGKFHGAVHAAGVFPATPLRAYDEKMAREAMDISFWSGIRLVQIANKKKNSEPRCSNILFSSIAADIGNKANFAYSGAKAAVRAAIRSIGKEIYQTGNRINTISPGWVDTEMTLNSMKEGATADKVLAPLLLGRGKPEDVSGMVLFLLSDRARWITGEDFVVDGGYLMGGYN